MNADLMILVKQYDMEQIMKKYDVLHNLEKQKNYDNKIETKTDEEKTELAKFINDNFDKMDDVEKRMMAIKCLDVNEIKKILLLFELKNFKPRTLKYLSLNDFKNKAINIFNRYQCKAGGFLMDDTEWKIYDFKSMEYEVNENELLFVNTINEIDNDDYECDLFLKYLIKQLNSICENIVVQLRQTSRKKSKVIKFLLWAKDITMKSTQSIVGL